MTRSDARARLLLFPAAGLVLAAVGAGCGDDKPAYCDSASELKSAVQGLDDVNIRENGAHAMQVALADVRTNAQTFVTDAKTAFGPQVSQLRQAVSGLGAAVQSVVSDPSVSAAQAVGSSVEQVKSATAAVQTAVADRC